MEVGKAQLVHFLSLFLAIGFIIVSSVLGHTEETIPILAAILFTCNFVVQIISEQNKNMFVLFFWIAQLGNIWSNALLESVPGYIMEEGRYSSNIGSTVWLTFFCILFFLVVSMVQRKMKFLSNNMNNKKSITVEEYAVIVLVGVDFLVLSFGLILYGSPLLAGISRFDYWNAIAPGYLSSAFTYLPYVSFMGSILYVHGVIRKRLFLLSIFISFVFCILYGDKFSGMFLILLTSIIPLALIKREISIRRLLRFCVRALLVVGIFIGAIYWHYSRGDSIGVDLFINMIDFRFRLQGHVWWGTVYEYLNGDIDHIARCYDEFVQFIKPAVFRETNENVGLVYLMRLVGDPRLVPLYLENNVYFTMGYPAIIVSMGGFLGTIFAQVFFGILVGFYCNFLQKIIYGRRYIESLLMIKLDTLLFSAINMGNLFNFFSWNTVLVVVLIWAITVMRRNRDSVQSRKGI